DDEQRVLRRASVFAGGFTLAAGTTVCGHDAEGGPADFEILDRVDSLVRKSLLQVERTATDLRYGMLETIRQFAEERLAESTETFGWAAEVVDVARTMEHRQLPLLLTMACDSAWGLGQLDAAKAYGHEAVALVDDPRFEPIVWAYADLAQIALYEGDMDTALQ